ncbi:MAG: tetratricopeptide repeat protein, partial [Bryobacteraceae bacterium]
VKASVEPAPAGLVWTVLGRLALQLGRFDAAEARLRQAVLVWPESLVWLGELEFRRGRLIESRAAWRRAMEHGLADARTLLRLAVLEQDLPEGEMTPVLERLLEVDPAQEEARLALVSQYIRQGRWAEAWRRLQQVRNAPPRWVGFYQQAMMLARTRLHAAEPLGTN